MFSDADLVLTYGNLVRRAFKTIVRVVGGGVIGSVISLSPLVSYLALINLKFIMAEQSSMPAGFGGLVRYNEEYDSKFKFGPGAVIAMIIAVIAFVVALRLFS